MISKRIEDHQSAQGRLFMKPLWFGPIYEHHFNRFKTKPITLVEIGIGKGGSLQVWKEYFGAESTIYGVDVNDALAFDDPEIKFMIGNQNDPDFLKTIPNMDILIDDGSHVCQHQITAFENLFDKLPPGGLYVVEDVHTSYREKEYGGGYKKPGTFIEYCKDLIDSVYYLEDPRIQSPINGKIGAIYFYLTLVIIQKYA